MNVLKKLIGGGSGKKNSGGKGEKKHSKDDDEYDYEADHCETDFDQQFEQARRSTSTSVPPPIMSQCEYRGSFGVFLHFLKLILIFDLQSSAKV